MVVFPRASFVALVSCLGVCPSMRLKAGGLVKLADSSIMANGETGSGANEVTESSGVPKFDELALDVEAECAESAATNMALAAEGGSCKADVQDVYWGDGTTNCNKIINGLKCWGCSGSGYHLGLKQNAEHWFVVSLRASMAIRSIKLWFAPGWTLGNFRVQTLNLDATWLTQHDQQSAPGDFVEIPLSTPVVSSGVRFIGTPGQPHFLYRIVEVEISACEQACDWQCYLNRYNDLQKLYGTNTAAAKQHWTSDGQAQGRLCTCPQARRFELGVYGENVCPSGYSKLTEQGQCEAAAVAFGIQLTSSGAWGHTLRGCYQMGETHSGQGKIYFNTEGDQANQNVRPVCALQAAPPTPPQQADIVVSEGGSLSPSSCTANSVTRAWYGVSGYEWTTHGGRDVTEKVKGMLREGKVVAASNSNFGDPAYRRRKILIVSCKQDDWYLAEARQSCTDACRGVGLSCDVSTFHSHLSDVDSDGEMQGMIERAGSTCAEFNRRWPTSIAPSIRTDIGRCTVADSSRALSSMDCAAIGHGWSVRRLCHCVKQATIG